MRTQLLFFQAQEAESRSQLQGFRSSHVGGHFQVKPAPTAGCHKCHPAHQPYCASSGPRGGSEGPHAQSSQSDGPFKALCHSRVQTPVVDTHCGHLSHRKSKFRAALILTTTKFSTCFTTPQTRKMYINCLMHISQPAVRCTMLIFPPFSCLYCNLHPLIRSMCLKAEDNCQPG